MSFSRSLVCLSLLLINGTARADWPARIFAPYAYIGADGQFKITACSDACAQKYFALAFIIADAQRQAAWDGRVPMDKDLYAEQIAAIRKRGGDVIASFGGQGGSELALADDKADSLAAKYQSVIDRYHFTWLDFDIEGSTVTNQGANHRRNTALAKLQSKNPGLILSYTLPACPDGLAQDALILLADAKAQGVKVRCVNIMTMDFGAYYSKGKGLADVCIASAEKVHEQLVKLDPTLSISLTPMIGQNDTAGEVFNLADARALRAWADAHAWISGLSFWSVNRDCGDKKKTGLDQSSKIDQKAWEFTGIFQSFGH